MAVLSKKIARWSREHSLVSWVLFLLAWEAASRFFPIPSAIRILWLAWKDITNPVIALAMLGSLKRMAIGFSAVMMLGIGLGMLIGRFRGLDNVLGTLASALNAMPGAAWVPLAIFLFGLNQKAVIFTIVLGATGIVMLNTRLGIRDVPPLILRAARTMGVSETKIFWHVVFPSSIPRMVDGLRLAWAFGWRGLMAGELLISSVHGMGEVINQVAKQRDINQLLALMVIIIAIGMVVDGFIFNKLIGDRIRSRWGTA